TDARRGGVPYRGVRPDLVPGSAQDGDDPDDPLLPLHLPHDRAGLAEDEHEGRDHRYAAAEDVDQAVLVSLHVTDRDRGADGDRVHAVPGRGAGDAAGVRAELPAPGDRDDTVAVLQRATGRGREHALGDVDLC